MFLDGNVTAESLITAYEKGSAEQKEALDRQFGIASMKVTTYTKEHEKIALKIAAGDYDKAAAAMAGIEDQALRSVIINKASEIRYSYGQQGAQELRSKVDQAGIKKDIETSKQSDQNEQLRISLSNMGLWNP